MAQDDLNRSTVEALMAALGIDNYSDLARRMERASLDMGAPRRWERTVVSRVLRDKRAAQPSFVVACAAALRVPTVAITGQGIDVSLQDELVA